MVSLMSSLLQVYYEVIVVYLCIHAFTPQLQVCPFFPCVFSVCSTILSMFIQKYTSLNSMGLRMHSKCTLGCQKLQHRMCWVNTGPCWAGARSRFNPASCGWQQISCPVLAELSQCGVFFGGGKAGEGQWEVAWGTGRAEEGQSHGWGHLARS